MISRGLGFEVPVAAALVLLAVTGARAHDNRSHERNDDRSDDPDDQAAADTTRARAHAQELLERGNDLFRTGSFAEALRAYREAHQVFPSPKLFFNIGRCEENLGHRLEAMVSLSAFVKLALDADPLVHAEAERHIADLAQRLAAVNLSGLPPNASVTVDGKTVGLTPLHQPLWLEPGTHHVSVERPGRPLWVSMLDGKAGTTIALDIPEAAPPTSPTSLTSDASSGTTSGPEAPAPPVAPQHSPSWGRSWWLWTAVGLIVAGAATVLVIKLRECPATRCSQ